MKIETFDLPSFWAVPLMYGDTSGMTGEDETALDEFEAYMVAEYGSCRCIDVTDNGDDFRKFHDALEYGVKACNVETFTFDVSPVA